MGSVYRLSVPMSKCYIILVITISMYRVYTYMYMALANGNYVWKFYVFFYANSLEFFAIYTQANPPQPTPGKLKAKVKFK